MAGTLSFLIDLAEQGRLPDWLVRLGIRRLIADRLRQEARGGIEQQAKRFWSLLASLRASAIALSPEIANQQHYEEPPEFFAEVLGPRLKYSASLWAEGIHNLAEAEERMLETYAQRAQLADGMRLLDLGCGWGSFALWAAEKYPNSEVLAVSNSHNQRRWIHACAKHKGITNLTCMTQDVNSLKLAEQFDRIVSIEMFEHMRNYAELLSRISSWLRPDGKLFVHIFCHRHLMYPFETEGAGNWMGRNFFTGGLMPSRETLCFFQDHLRLERRWDLSGTHYARTARAWLDRLDANHQAASAALEAHGQGRAPRGLSAWRLFFMACEELFGWNGGNEWLVGHFLFAPRHTQADSHQGHDQPLVQ